MAKLFEIKSVELCKLRLLNHDLCRLKIGVQCSEHFTNFPTDCPLPDAQSQDTQIEAAYHEGWKSGSETGESDSPDWNAHEDWLESEARRCSGGESQDKSRDDECGIKGYCLEYRNFGCPPGECQYRQEAETGSTDEEECDYVLK